MDRDALLAAALGAAVLTGCTSRDRDPSPMPRPSPSPTPTVDPDSGILYAWCVSEMELVRVCVDIGRRRPALRALVSNHSARASALMDHMRVRGEAPPRLKAVGPQPPKPLRTLARMERTAAAEYLADLARVTDPAVVTLGAELAAGARQHATLLGLLA